MPRREEEAPDSAELDALRELVRSPGYSLLKDRIEQTIEDRRNDMEDDGDPQRLRGIIAGLRLALRIPEILISEIKATL